VASSVGDVAPLASSVAPLASPPCTCNEKGVENAEEEAEKRGHSAEVICADFAAKAKGNKEAEDEEQEEKSGSGRSLEEIILNPW